MQAEIESNEAPGWLGYKFGSACFVAAWAVVPLWHIFASANPEPIPFFGFCVISTAGIFATWLFHGAIRMATDVSRNGRACLRLANSPASGGELDARFVLDRAPYNLGLIRFELLCLRGSNFKGNADWNYTRLWSGAGTAVVRRNSEGGEAALRIPIPPRLPATQTLDCVGSTSEIEFLWLLVIAGGPGGERIMTRSFNVPVETSETWSRDELLALPEGLFYDVLVPRLTSDSVEGNGTRAVAVVALILIIASTLNALHSQKFRRTSAKSATLAEAWYESSAVTWPPMWRHAREQRLAVYQSGAPYIRVGPA